MGTDRNSGFSRTIGLFHDRIAGPLVGFGKNTGIGMSLADRLGNPVISTSAMAAYRFDFGLIEWVNKQFSMLLIRDAQKHYDRRGEIVTAEMGEAAITSDGILIEPLTTQLLENSGWENNGVGISDWQTIGAFISKTMEGYEELTFDSVSTLNHVRYNNPTMSVSTTYTFSVLIKHLTALEVKNVVTTVNLTGVVRTFYWRGVEVVDTDVISGSGLLELVTALTTDAVGSFRCGCGATTPVTASGTFYLPLLEEGNRASLGRIVSGIGLTETRDADAVTFPVLSEIGVLKETSKNSWTVGRVNNGCQLGDFDDGGDWLSGVNTTVKKLTFAQTDGNNGKFEGLIDEGWNEKAIYSETNGTKLRVDQDGSSNLLYTLMWKPSHLTEAEAVQQGFERNLTKPNYITIEHIYGRHTETAFAVEVEQLRSNAGDDVSRFPAVAPWQSDNWRATIKLKLRKIATQTLWYAADITQTNVLLLHLIENGVLVFTVMNTSGTTQVLLPLTITPTVGEPLVVSVSRVGTTLVINSGVDTNTEPTFVGDTIFTLLGSLGGGLGFFGIDALSAFVEDFTFEDIS